MELKIARGKQICPILNKEHVELFPAKQWNAAKPAPYQLHQHFAVLLAFWWGSGIGLFSNCKHIYKQNNTQAFQTWDQTDTQLHRMAPLSANGPPDINGNTYAVIYHYPLWIRATVNKLWKPYSSCSCAWWLAAFQHLLNTNKWNKVGDSNTLISVSTSYTFVPSVWAIIRLHKYLTMPVGSHAKL